MIWSLIVNFSPLITFILLLINLNFTLLNLLFTNDVVEAAPRLNLEEETPPNLRLAKPPELTLLAAPLKEALWLVLLLLLEYWEDVEEIGIERFNVTSVSHDVLTGNFRLGCSSSSYAKVIFTRCGWVDLGNRTSLKVALMLSYENAVSGTFKGQIGSSSIWEVPSISLYDISWKFSLRKELCSCG